MSIKDLPFVTVEQVVALRKAAIELEAQLAEAAASRDFWRESHKTLANSSDSQQSKLITGRKRITELEAQLGGALSAMVAIRDDLLIRSDKMDSDGTRVVNCSAGVWTKLSKAIDQARGDG